MPGSATRRPIAVIGAGLMGCSLALELARRGERVELFDRRDAPMRAASRHGEGKLHLGFVYAADPSMATARLMARGAGAFLPALRRWVGGDADRIAVSAPFVYAVHRDSLLTPGELERRYATIAALAREHAGGGRYPGGGDPGRVERVQRLTEHGDAVQAAFATQEVAVAPDDLGPLVASAVAEHPSIRLRVDCEVLAVDRPERALTCRNGSGPEHHGPFAHVVSCAWDGGPHLDRTAGVAVAATTCVRRKYALHVRLAPGSSLPSTTVVLGPFGDVVDYGDGRAYVSWYPAGRVDWTQGADAAAWPDELTGAAADDVRDGTAAGLQDVLPGAARIAASGGQVRGGAILARGTSDVDDPASELHERHRVGPSHHGGYVAMNTGKLTLAPLLAVELADRLAPAHG